MEIIMLDYYKDYYDSIIRTFGERYGVDACNKLIAYMDLVLVKNEHINLTAIRDRGEALVKHVVDSLEITKLPEFNSAERIIDVGTGAGFPGALLAIASPEKEFVLLDSTKKRLRVIDELSETLAINNLTTLHARAEEINRKPPHGGAYDLCVSRAVAGLDTLSAWCLPFLKPGGTFVAYKGDNYAGELDAASGTLKRCGATLERVVPYENVPAEISGHVLIVISKK